MYTFWCYSMSFMYFDCLLHLSVSTVRVCAVCVCGVCVCVLATLTMKLEFRSEVLVFVMLINLCQCVVCVSLPDSFGSMLLKFFRPCSLFPSPSPGVVFKNSFFFNLNYILLKLKLNSQLKRCSSTVFERFTSSFQRIHFIHFILANLEPNKIH